MASHLTLSDGSGNGLPLDFRHEDASRQITQPDASGGIPNGIEDNYAEEYQLGSNQEEQKDNYTHGNERRNNTESTYQQTEPNLAMPLSRSISQETAPSFSSSSRKTPIRAVFYDLPTAHLSITSGFARSRSQNASGSLLEAHSEDEPIPLQDPQPPTIPDDVRHIQPLPPVTVPSANHQSYNILSRRVPDQQNEASVAQNVNQQKHPALGDLDPAAVLLANDQLPAISFSDIRDEASGFTILSQSPQQAMHPGFTNEVENPIRDKTTDTLTNDNGFALMHQSFSPERKFSHALLVPEESTVDNIYRHYASSSTGGWESDKGTPRRGLEHNSYHLSSSNGLSTASQLDSQAKPSALSVRKQRRVDKSLASPDTRPPSYALPALPTSSPNHFAASMSQGLGVSSSYGDTKNLLEITQPPKLTVRKATLSRSDGRTDLRLQDVTQRLGVNDEPSITTSSSHNPFHTSSHPPGVTSLSNDIDCIYDDDHNSEDVTRHRPPLERAVSQALRRASGFSAFSNGSASSSLLHDETSGLGGLSFKRTTFNTGLRINGTGTSNPQRTRQVSTDAQGFYNERAISSSWITPHQRNSVRVPINRRKIFQNSTPESGLEPTDMPLGHQDDTAIDDFDGDANDWETVGESRFGAEFKDSQDIGGMFEMSTIHRTGSSVANTSNDGTISIYDAESDGFGSTERITQHPGIIRYSGDYRQRDINVSPMPVFPPVYREHKVNGYLAGLTLRHPHSSPFSHVPRPLESPHTNPFGSPPPEALTTPTARRTLFQKHSQRAPRPNHFLPSTKPLYTTEVDSMTGEDMVSISSASTTTTLAERNRTYRKLNWNAEPTYPSPALSHSKRQFLSPINPVGRPDRPSSWRHLMVFGRGDKIEGYNADGTPNSESSAWAPTESTDSSLHAHIQGDGSIELGQYRGQRRSTNLRERQPLVKGPPGAFYRGIARTQKDPNPAHSSDAPGRPAKIPTSYASPRDYPTNVLRPLSLLANGPITLVGSENLDHLSDTRLPDLAYHSPLATPRRLSWQQLYTIAQLKSMEEAAKVDSLYDVSLVPNVVQGIRQEPAHRQLYDGSSFNQQLNSWTQASSARIDRYDQTRKFSNFFLLFCALFPPLLLLFALGRLDRVITWWSKGEVTAFGDKQKRLAQVLTFVYGFAIFVGLILILVFRFAPPSQPPAATG